MSQPSIDILTEVAKLVSQRDALSKEVEKLRGLVMSQNGYEHMVPIDIAANKLGCSKPHIYKEA